MKYSKIGTTVNEGLMEKINILKDKLSLNTSSIIKLALLDFFEKEK